MILQLSREHVESLKQEAQKAHPVEACAILFGELTKKQASVRKVTVAPNTLQSTVRFEIEPREVVEAMEEAEQEGLEFIGLFHSHPAPATPSKIDLKFMRFWGDAVWLILSSTEGTLSAFQIKNGELKKIPVLIDEA